MNYSTVLLQIIFFSFFFSFVVSNALTIARNYTALLVNKRMQSTHNIILMTRKHFIWSSKCEEKKAVSLLYVLHNWMSIMNDNEWLSTETHKENSPFYRWDNSNFYEPFINARFSIDLLVEPITCDFGNLAFFARSAFSWL